MDNIYEEYAIIDSQIEVLEAKKADIRVKIVKDMTTRGVLTEKHSLGAFTITKLKSWTYPEYVEEKKKEVKAVEDEFKALKKKSEDVGDATYEESDSLRFTSVKL